MNDLLNILTTAEGQLRVASREAFKLSAVRAAKGATDEANLCAAAGMSLGSHADDLMRAAGDLKRAQDAKEAQKVKPGERVVSIEVQPMGPDGRVIGIGRIR